MNFHPLFQSQTQRPAISAGAQLWFVLVGALGALAGSPADAAPATGTPNARFHALPAAQRSEIYQRTDEAFWKKHPELNGAKLKADSDPKLIQEYLALRRDIADATLRTDARDNAKSTQDAARRRYVHELDPTGGDSSAGRSSAPTRAAASPSTGSVNPAQLEARAQSMVGEMTRLASEYENASPARQQQILARYQQIYGEAMELRDLSLALAQSHLASGNPKAPSIPGGGAMGAGDAGTAGLAGKLTPATSLATSPEKYLASLAAEREKKAWIRAEQQRIHLEGAKMQTTYRDEGTSDFDKAAARAGLDMFNGGARVGMAFAPEWLYQGYEGLNSATESINAAQDLMPWDATKGAQSAATGFKDAKAAYQRIEPSELTRFDKLGLGMEVVDLGVNGADFFKAGKESDRLEQTKEGLAVAGNVATLAAEMDRLKSGAGVASRIVSGANGALAIGEGADHINQTLDDKAAFERSADRRIQDAQTQARAAAERARLNQQLATFLRDLEARAHNEAQSVVPPSQTQNQEYFKIP